MLLAALLLPAPAAAQLGPLSVMELNPLYALGYTPTTDSADPSPRGTFAATLAVRYANIYENEFNSSLDLRLDTERMVNELVLRYGLLPGVEVGGRFALRTDRGGFLDAPIATFHKAFQLANGGRSAAEDDQVELRLHYRDEINFMLPKTVASPEDVRLFLKGRILGGRDGAASVAVRAVAQLPTGSPEVSAGHADFGVDVIGRRSGEVWHAHGQLGVVTVRAADELKSHSSGHSVLTAAGIERDVGSGVSLASEFVVLTPYFHDFGEDQLDRPSMSLAVGTIFEPAAGWKCELSFTEDFPGNNPSADVVLGLRISRIF